MLGQALVLPLLFSGAALQDQVPALSPSGQTAPALGPGQLRHSTAQELLVVTEVSRIRLHPREYAKWLRTQLKYFEGTLWRLPDHVPIRTNEGASALQELIDFLESTPVVGPLRWNEGLSHAARQLVLEQGPTGQTGHKGPAGSTVRDRVLKFGLHQSLLGEVINYGDEKPRWTVMQLLIDDGVPNRGHRKNLFNPDFHVAGAAIGPHSEYGSMTVVDLVDDYTSNPEYQERAILSPAEIGKPASTTNGNQ